MKIIKSPKHSLKDIETSKLIKQKVSKALDIKHPVSNLGKYPTSNLIGLLIVSALISMISGGRNIFKKK